MKKLDNKGFSVVEALLILVAIVMVAGTASLVYSSQNETKNSLDKVTDSQPEAQRSGEDKSETGQQTYFKINELGVQFEPTEALHGLYYHIGNSGRTAYFSTEELRTTDCAADKTAQISLSQYSEEDFAEDNFIAPLKESSKKIGSYYYSVVGGQAACSEDKMIQDKANDLRIKIGQQLPGDLLEIQ